ncbi:MAG: hypothetical protein CMJ46_15475 [Planctomyces sp.]|nr:hypothetical protein [Planctomyces sp.]
MSSPFSYFRKYAKELTVALIGLSMFAFIVLDMMRPQHLPMVMLALLGAVVFFFLGKNSGRRIIYTAVGLLAGAVLGSQFTGFAEAEPPVSVNEVPLERMELEELVQNRYRANQFLMLAQEEALGPQALQMQGGPVTFGFGLPTYEDVVLGKILIDIGEELRVAVTDTVVADFIKEITQDKITTKTFNEILERMSTSAGEINEILRHELKASLAYKLHARHLNPTPSDYWDTFRKTKIEQELQVVPIPTEKFIPLVNNNPTDSEIEKYFDKYKDKLPRELGMNAPGFKVPRKVNLEYLMADRDALQDELSQGIEITDEEVEEFYEENKETYRNVNPFPADNAAEGGPAMEGPDMTAPETDREPAAAERPAAEAAAAEETPAEKTPAEESTEESTPTEEPQPESEEAAAEEAPVEEAPVEEAPAEEGEPQSSLNSNRAAALASVQDEAAPAEETPAEEAPTEEAPTEEEQPGEESPANETPAEEESPAEEAPAADAAAEEAPAGSDQKPATKQPEYRPLDDDLRAQIREQLLNRKINAKMYEMVEQAQRKMDELSREYREASLDTQDRIREANDELTSDQVEAQAYEELKPLRVKITEALKKIAKETKLVYKTTGLVDIIELSSPEEMENFDPATDIGNSTPAASPETMFSPNTDPVWYNVFQPGRRQLYYPSHTSGTGLNNNHYVYWKTEDVSEHIPELEGEVRKEVKESLVKDLAKTPAAKRAQEIAEKIKANDGKIAETITDLTITGKEDGEKLSFIPVKPFTWMVERSVQGSQGFPQTQLRLNEDIEGLEAIDDTFMRVTFEGMQVGGVQVVPNSGGETLYIVKVISRSPSTEEEMNTLYASFVDSLSRSLQLQRFLGPSPYARTVLEESQAVRREYIQKIFELYNVKFNLNQQI